MEIHLPSTNELPGMILVLIFAFLWGCVATSEIKAIAMGETAKAIAWSAANSTLTFLITFIIALTLSLPYIIPFVLGNILATAVVLCRRSHR